MRKLLVVLALVAAALAGGLEIGTVVLRRLVAQRREAILAAAEQAVGRRLSVGALDIRLLATPSLRISTLRVAEDPRFGDGPFLTAASANAHLRVWPLLWGRVVVSRLRIERPEIYLARDATGVWNVSTLGSANRARPDPAGPAAWLLGTALATTGATPTRSEWPLNDLRITDGVALVTDNTTQPPRRLRLADVAVRLHDLSWDQPVQLSLQAGIDAEHANVHVSGHVGPLHAADGVAIDLTGDAGPFPPLDSRVTDIRLVARVTADRVTVTALTGHAFDGAFELAGEYAMHPPDTAHARGTIHAVAIRPLLRLAAPDVAAHFDGHADARFDLQAMGHTAADLSASLAGTVTTDVQDGEVTGLNIPSEVLRRVARVENPASLLSERTRRKYGRIFSETTTRFETMHASMRVGGQRVHSDDVTVAARDYGMQVRGWVAFDRRVDLDGRLRLSRQFSSDLAADIKLLRHLLDAEGQVAVPFRMRGRLGEAYPEPDVGDLLERTLRGLDRGGGMGGLLDKLFGGRKDHAGATK